MLREAPVASRNIRRNPLRLILVADARVGWRRKGPVHRLLHPVENNPRDRSQHDHCEASGQERLHRKPSLLHAPLLLAWQGYHGPQEPDDQNSECNIIEGCHGIARPGGHAERPL